MIPVKLQLQNFMAYKTPEVLDFTGIRLACLSGENGAGKSTLLDAMTWAVWGKARTTQMDSLIHLGETEMEVEFCFDLGDETYRVLRKRTSIKRGKTELHFHIADAGGWRTLTEDSIRLTQDKIDRLLRLDYDTFINSAFLLQGRADEFTNKTPRDRKQILADILGLGLYDEYEDRAKEMVRQYDLEIGIIEGQINRIDEEMAREAEYQAELEAGRKQAAQLKRELSQIDQQLGQVRDHYKGLDHKQRQLDDLQTRLAQVRADSDELDQTLADTQTKIVRHQLVIAQKEAIEAGYQALQAAQSELDDWNNRLAQSTPLLQDQHRLEKAIQEARSKLETEIRLVQNRLEDLTPRVTAIPTLRSELAQLESSLVALQALEREREEDRQKMGQINAETARLEEENRQLRDDMDRIKSRLTHLEAAGSACPICTQPLTEAHREQVKAGFVSDGTTKGDNFRRNRANFQEMVETQKRLEAAIKQADRQLKQLPGLQGQVATKQQALIEAEAAQTKLGDFEQMLADLQKALAEGGYEVEAMAQLKEIQAELAGLGFDNQARAAAQKQVEELAHFAAELRQLQDAQARLPEEEERLKRDQARRERLLAQTAEDRRRIDELAEETKKLPEVAAEVTRLNRELDRLQRDETMARNAVIAAEQKLNLVARQAKDRTQKEEKLAELRQSRGIYQELRTAFGKNGVQALLIEYTIPELEDEANNILARMTDGRMNLQFLTQRETKTGQSLIETLDIRIADEIGTRDYELYSGGEAFRVNFAIRIALSKLLARRSGARLQTLVIDEGFGTQDAQGRERLVEAINKIQDEFEKIMVITHIDELKDAFPTRILIQKGAEGSRIIVS